MGLDFDRPYDKQYFQEEHEKLAPERIMLLSFNYTKTAQLYGGSNVVHNYIHGGLTRPETIIFGYGDELDKNYQDILDKNNNELLKKCQVNQVFGNKTLSRFVGIYLV